MKKPLIKLIAVSIITALTMALTSCTYIANGSVIQDVDFQISYQVGEETTTINSTLSLYKTFAPETTDRIEKLVKNGFYNNTALTLSKQQDYVIVGGYTYNADYEVKPCSEGDLRGEFTYGGFQARNKLRPGALVMLRDFDDEVVDGEGVNSSKYLSAKGAFAIVLTDSNTVFSKDTFCIFGYIDDDSLATLQEALIDNCADEKGYYKMRYLGDRVDGNQTYANSFDYYFDSNNDYFKEVNGSKVPLKYSSKEDEDYPIYEVISSGKNLQDVITLPSTLFKVNKMTLK